MDKREYQEKLQEINRLIAAEDYEGAAHVADSIDWKRVRNVQTLVMISEVYEALERYEDSKVLLLRAYRRSPVGRTVLYRLVECCIKLRQFDQAIEYYSEYVQAAPHDNNKYILKYKIYRGRGSSLDEQIDILKSYLDQEYNEKWAYELARLQIQADHVQEGLATCDDLVLWFHSGKYVIKALELKKKYAPLTPKQQEIYDNRFDEEDDEPELRPESYLSEAASLAKAERAAAAQEEIKSELAADISHTAKMEATKAELTRKAEEAQAEVDRKAAESMKALTETKEEAEEAAEETAKAAGTSAAAAGMAVAAAGTSAAAAGMAVAASEMAAEAEVTADAVTDALFGTESEPETNATVNEEAPAAAQEKQPAQTESAQPETAQIEETQAEAAQPEAAQIEEAQAESAQPETAQIEETQAEAVQPETAQIEEAQAEAEQPEAVQIEKAQAEAAQPETAQIEEAQAEAAQPETAQSEETAPEYESEPVSPEQMQADMIRSMREIVSGVGPKEQIGEDEAALEEAIDQSKEDQENAVAARGTDMTFRVPTSEASQKRQAGRLTIDDILLSMGDRGDHVRQVTGGTVMSATEEAQMTAQHQAEAKAASYDGTAAADAASEGSMAAGAILGGGMAAGAVLGGGPDTASEDKQEPEIPRFLRDEVHEARQTSEIPATEIAEADDALRAQMGLESRDEAADGMTAQEDADAASVAAPSPEMDEAAAAAAFMSTARVPYTKEIAEAKTRRLPVDEIRKLHEAYLTENSSAAEEAAKNASQAAEAAAEMAEAEAAAGAYEEDDDIRIAEAPGAGEARQQTAGAEAPALGAAAVEESISDEASMAAAAGVGAAAGAAVGGSIGEQVTREVPKSEPEPQVFTGRPQLKENQKDLFRGFTSIGSLSEQIAGAIWQAENRKDDRTSRTGNILILGAHGCGKTTIATGIAKAIAEDKGTHSVKMARIYAADLNRKDIAATIAKIAGGVLIVEEAGDLDDAIVDQLTTAMEFRTDGLIMILEDEQRYIHDLLMRHPRFTMKFTAQIYIPEYTGEDLINFGQIYANSKDYVLSEKAVEACRSRVEAAKKSGEAVSVTNVIELVDRAIKNANTFFRRIGSAKKRYDSEDRVILREKDFR